MKTDFFIGHSLRLRKNNNFSATSGLKERWSDLVGRIGFGLTENTNLTYSFTFNKDKFNTRRDELSFSTQIYNNTINIGYIYLEPTTGISDEREEVHFSTTQKFNDNPFSIKFQKHITLFQKQPHNKCYMKSNISY